MCLVVSCKHAFRAFERIQPASEATMVVISWIVRSVGITLQSHGL